MIRMNRWYNHLHMSVILMLTVFEYKEIVPFATVAGVNAVLVALVT